MDKDKVKNVRRAAKGTLTRAFTACKELIDAQRPVVEVKEAFDVVKNAYNSLEVKHEEFTVLLDDTQYDEAEQWMQACNSEYMKFSMMYNDYLNANVTENEKDDVVNQANEDENNANVDGENDENNGVNDDQESLDMHEPADDELSSVTKNVKLSSPFALKHEKPKLPKFDGDVRQYFIFKSDFQHAVEAHCSERARLQFFGHVLVPNQQS
jgi:hypothetical protein